MAQAALVRRVFGRAAAAAGGPGSGDGLSRCVPDTVTRKSSETTVSDSEGLCAFRVDYEAAATTVTMRGLGLRG
jgi:hypothetical protein